jgi:uncharacterized protein YjbI with pentapeptide repeats
MANPEHLEILRKGADAWNEWHSVTTERPDLSDLNFEKDIFVNRSFYDLPTFGAHDFSGTNLNRVVSRNSTFLGCSFDNCQINFADFCYSMFLDCTFRNCRARVSKFGSAKFEDCLFEDSDLSYSTAGEASFERSRLVRCTLDHMSLVRTDFSRALLEEVSVYGISAWDLKLTRTVQRDIRVPSRSTTISVDNIELAQFIHLLVNNSKLRGVIDTITSKIVLVLGRFSPERKATLNRLKRALSEAGYVAVVFDFAGPTSRDLSEVVSTLAHLSRFVVVDLSDPRSVPHELAVIVPALPSVPIQPIIAAGQEPFALFSHWTRYASVLPTIEYDSTSLGATIDGVIRACEGAAVRLRPSAP